MTACNINFTPPQTSRNNSPRYWTYRIQAMFREGFMLALAAAGAFLGLFTMWVILPRKFFRKNK